MSDTVDIEYIGDPPILDDYAMYKIAVGEIPPDAAAVLRGAAMMRSVAIEGVGIRVVDPDTFGVSKVYQFGPHDFVVAVDKQDVDKILGSDSGYQFRRTDDPLREMTVPVTGIRVVSEVEGVSLSDVYR